MRIDAEQSNIIHWMSLFAIVCVVLGHCRIGSDAVQIIIFDTFCQWHVPFFYLTGGMFLSISLTNHSWTDVIQKRLRTLVVPYFLWCLIPLLLKGESGVSCSVDEAFAFSTSAPYGNPHLWYLHCLIIFVISAILIWRVFAFLPEICRRILWGISFASLAWFVERLGLKTLYGTPTSPFYFLSGFVLSPLLFSRKMVKFAGGGVFVAILSRIAWFVLAPKGIWEMLMRMICVYSMIIAVWVVFWGFARRKSLAECPSWLRPVFFVYCFHGLLLPLCKHLCIDVLEFPATWTGMILLTIIVLLISFSIGNMMKKMCLVAYGYLSGGR